LDRKIIKIVDTTINKYIPRERREGRGGEIREGKVREGGGGERRKGRERGYLPYQS